MNQKNRIRLIICSGFTLPFQALFAQNAVYSDQSKVLWNTFGDDRAEYKNVLLLLFDDMRSDCLGYAGGAAKTPAIDKLAEQSCRFTTAITTTGLSSPSRAALLTGRWGHRTGLDDNVQVWQSRLKGLGLEKTTVLEWSREKGYFTGYFGKWHLGNDGPIRRGVHRFTVSGFENSAFRGEYVTVDFHQTDKYYEKGKTFNEKPEYYGTRPGTIKETDSYKIASDGISFLREAKSMKRPFFLTLSFHGPHPPYLVPAPYNTMYDYRNIKLPASFRDPYNNKPAYQKFVLWPWLDTRHMTEDDWKKTTSYFYGFISMIDEVVGMVMSTLEKEGLADNTLIVFASDQGSMVADHGLYDKGPYSYDELMRIPLTIKVPGIEPHDINRHVSLIDLNQTLVEWMGLDPSDPNTDSRSLFPLIRGDKKAVEGDDMAFYAYEWYNGKWYGIRTIRTRDFKYCYNSVDVDELYDLKNDPFEMNNLYDSPDLSEQQRVLQEKLLSHLKETDDPLFFQMKTYLENREILKK